MYARQCTYSDFLKSEEKIATNILASRLEMLESTGLISKSQHPDSKAKVLYRLTQKGIDLLPTLTEIYLWGDKYFALTNHHKAVVKDIKKDKEGFIRKVTDKLRKSMRLSG